MIKRVINFRCSEQDYQFFKQAAENSGLESMSMYLRYCGYKCANLTRIDRQALSKANYHAKG